MDEAGWVWIQEGCVPGAQGQLRDTGSSPSPCSSSGWPLLTAGAVYVGRCVLRAGPPWGWLHIKHCGRTVGERWPLPLRAPSLRGDRPLLALHATVSLPPFSSSLATLALPILQALPTLSAKRTLSLLPLKVLAASTQPAHTEFWPAGQCCVDCPSSPRKLLEGWE